MAQQVRTTLFYAKGTPDRVLRRFAGARQILLRAHADMSLPDAVPGERWIFALPNDRLAQAAALCREANCADVQVLPTDLPAMFLHYSR